MSDSPESRPRVVTPLPAMGRGLPRPLDWTLAAGALILSLPLLAVAAAAVFISGGPPILFRQERVGLHGRTFQLYKLRSMNPEKEGPSITAANDSRITPVGRFLRRFKLDELPQFWNVVRGDMSLVGPRPEIPRFVDRENKAWILVLQARPGLTDPVTLTLRDEETLLAAAPGDPGQFYEDVLLPWKLAGYVQFLSERTWWRDLLILWQTVLRIFRLGSEPRLDLNAFLDDEHARPPDSD